MKPSPGSPARPWLRWWASGAAALALARVGGAVDARSPVDKVLNLLTKLRANIEADGAKDQAVYDKYACWCEATTARKVGDIEAGKTRLQVLGQEILKLKGTAAVRAREIEQLNAEIRENEKAQATATAIRQKENGEYMEESTEMKQALAALEKAIIVLREATKPALLQRDSTSRLQTALAALTSLPIRATAKLPLTQLTQIRSFSQQLAADKGRRAGYAPQSATIQGILHDMYANFGSELESMTRDEAVKNHDFEDYMATQQKALIEAHAELEVKIAEKAEAEEMLADAMQEFDDVSKQLKADIEFLDAVKPACEAKSTEWTERKALRDEELAGIDKALEILGSPEAKELFDKSIQTGNVSSFLQLGSRRGQQELPGAQKAYEALRGQASKSRSIRLATMAAQVRLAKAGHFDKVLKAIDNMLEDLKLEEQADIDKRDLCQKQYHEIESNVADLDWKIQNNEAEIQKLTKMIGEKETQRDEAIDLINQTNEEIVEMNETRVSENSAFLQAKADDVESIKLLVAARDALQEYYKNNGIDAGPVQGNVKDVLLQGDAPNVNDTAPDANFTHKGYRKYENKGIVAIITQIIEDLHGEIADGQAEEKAAQLEYEKQLAAAMQLISDLEQKVVNLEVAITDHKTARTKERNDKHANEGDRSTELNFKSQIEPDCDATLEKFEDRRKQRKAEHEALVKAREFLSEYYHRDEEKAASLVTKTTGHFRGLSRTS